MDYRPRFPWPLIRGEQESSIELIHPSLNNGLGAHWVASSRSSEGRETLIAAESEWRYLPGTVAPAGRRTSWMRPGFDDSAWRTGKAPIGYGETYLNTTLGDMQGRYTTAYFRKVFEITDPRKLGSLSLDALIDDGAVFYLHGQPLGRINHPTNFPSRRDIAAKRPDAGDYERVTQILSPLLLPGRNVLAAQVLNASLSGSSDFVFEARLEAEANSTVAPAPATPGRRNARWQPAEKAAPAIRQVEHWPRQPPPGADVTVTATITHPQGVAKAFLDYQIVTPHCPMTPRAITTPAPGIHSP